MGSFYDEDLTGNVFFRTLKKDYEDLFYKAIMEGCAICVPRSGSLPSYNITLDDILDHIIIPNDEMPESHFQTLSGKEVKICNRLVTMEHDLGCQFKTQILFEETYYTEDLLKYKVLCIENPLEPRTGENIDGVFELRTLRDCIDFLWIESGSKTLTDQMDKAIELFLGCEDAFDNASIQTLKDLTEGLYGKCLQLSLKDRRLKEKTYMNLHTLRCLKISVETYIHHGIYKQLFKCIAICTSLEDSRCNKIVRNSIDLQLRDLDVRAELHDLIPTARAELGKLSGYSTVLGKLNCLRKMIAAISRDPESGGMLAADDLLPIIIFLIIKTNIFNWFAQLTYLKHFHFASNVGQGGDEDEFLVTTLEAALEHVMSGVFLGPCQGTLKEMPATAKEGLSRMAYLFQQIAKGNLEEVRRILEFKEASISYGALELCHPLCTCAKCLHLININSKNNNPTVNSCDDAGITTLHVASMFGKPDIIDYLLSFNADPNVTDLNGCSPLHHAALRGHQHALLLLAQAGADVNSLDNSLNTSLHFCCSNGHEGCAKALIYFCEHENIQLLINAQNVNGDTPLHHAAKWGYLAIVQVLIENNADPSVVNKRKLSAFQVSNNSKVTTILSKARPTLQCRLNVRVVNFDFMEEEPRKRLVSGEIPMSIVVSKRVDKMLRAIECGDINLACFYLGLNPLLTTRHCHPLCTCAECNKHENSTASSPPGEKLKINVCNAEGYTALHMAAFNGSLDLTELLIRSGALIDVQTRSKLSTPLMLASQQQRIQVAKLLLDSGSKINLQDNKGNTALHYACIQSNRRLVEILLQHKPKLTLRNKNGLTALQEAEIKMALGIVTLLRR